MHYVKDILSNRFWAYIKNYNEETRPLLSQLIRVCRKIMTSEEIETYLIPEKELRKIETKLKTYSYDSSKE